MIIIGSKLYNIDNSGSKIVKCIKVYNSKLAKVGNFILISLVKFISNIKLKKKLLYFGLIITSTYWILRKDGLFLKSFKNTILLFSKNYKFLGTRIYGILFKEIKFLNCKELKTFNKIISYVYLVI